MHSLATQIVAAVLERLLNNESHANKLGARLVYEVNDAFGSVAVSKKIVYKQHLVALAKILFAYHHVISALFGKRCYLCREHVTHGAWLLFLCKHDG